MACDNKGDCQICLDTNVVLLCPTNTMNKFPDIFKTNCTHSICELCWRKISLYENICCPYCRENLEEWIQSYLNIPIFRNDETRTSEEKLEHAKFLSNYTPLYKIVIEDAENSNIESFFFPLDIDDSNIKLGIINGRRFRKICKHHYVVNEYFRNFSLEKIKTITELKSRTNGIFFYCFCDVKTLIQDKEKHIECDMHMQFMKFFIDNRFDVYATMFKYVNL